MNKKNFFFIFILFFSISSCQPIEKPVEIVFNNNLLSKITVLANVKNINQLYEVKFIDPYIDHSIEFSPLKRLESWLQTNIEIMGAENKFIINILEASLKKSEIMDNDKKSIFQYKIFYLIEFQIYNDADKLLSSTNVEALRTTTSSKYISLNQSEVIVNNLILEALIDLSMKSKELTKIYMSGYLF